MKEDPISGTDRQSADQSLEARNKSRVKREEMRQRRLFERLSSTFENIGQDSTQRDRGARDRFYKRWCRAITALSTSLRRSLHKMDTQHASIEGGQFGCEIVMRPKDDMLLQNRCEV